MSYLQYIDRKHTDCAKWDALTETFGDDDLLALWVADMDFKVPKCVTEALQKYLDQSAFGYYKVPDSYYEAFINWQTNEHGYTPKKDWIRFAPGVVPAFFWAINFLTKPQDAVIVLSPVYYPFFNAVQKNDRKLITCDLVNTKGIYTVDYDAFENDIIANNVKTFIFCSPHNPVGRVWKAEEIERLFAICEKHNVYIISDEIHQDLVYGDNKQIPSLTFTKYTDRIISMTAASKTFNLASCQNSLITIPDDNLRQQWDAFTSSISMENGNAFGYLATAAAYTNGKDWYEELKSTVYENYLYLKERLQEALPDAILSPLEGTYLTWLDLSAYIKPGETQDIIQKKCHLAVDYGKWFGGDACERFIRINLATRQENIRECADALIANL